jgi:predicted GIY-YIG superfamily endonuclease
MIISLMPDYSNAKIYKLVSDKTAMIYIGSTTKKLHERLSGHNTDFTKNHRILLLQKNYMN